MTPDALRVLLVDDDEVDRARVRRLLDGSYDVTEAATAADGLGHLEDAADVVLLDVRLPDDDGVNLVPAFAARGLPVVMLSGVEDTGVVVEAMRRGAMDYLVKSRMDAAALERAVRAAIETASLRRAVAEQQVVLGEQAAALEAKNAEVRALASALTLAEQAERQRISALLHDHLQQLLYGAQLMIESLRAAPRDGDRVTRAAEAVAQCVEAARELTLDLTPPVLDEEDFSVALAWVAAHVGERHGLGVEVVAEDAVVVPSRDLRVLLVELVRELLFNVVKHAGASSARIRLSRVGGRLTVAVEDDGGGFDPAALRTGVGFGLFSVRGRLELLGGRFEIDSVPGDGTRAVLSIDLEDAGGR